MLNPEVGKYANLILFSDKEPYEITRIVSDKTIEIRPMLSELVETWKPEMDPGGFAAHTVNNHLQKYVYESNKQALPIRCRLQKSGGWKSQFGFHSISDEPKKFYDYNF